MAAINQALKQRFEAQYAGTAVDLATQGTDAALQAVLDRTIDLAAIGRPLTDAERRQGLVEVPISREKIAIITSANNPFQATS
ncbi:substrate-binding domain-containing protein [Leptolyngbya sp. 7M]|uniref:substrate-binding domain-containing protein n=1 Tax=Leptolyngbya sp. 7M TaxID=2812896 RepID=UPI001B8B8276|nr:substrate-binding domain-containing protein [Leptolyngbya sp. 7M]QYO64760.1 substrate-binding domain-containing protein [Leptolyngbya sp. 7M]